MWSTFKRSTWILYIYSVSTLTPFTGIAAEPDPALQYGAAMLKRENQSPAKRKELRSKLLDPPRVKKANETARALQDANKRAEAAADKEGQEYDRRMNEMKARASKGATPSSNTSTNAPVFRSAPPTRPSNTGSQMTPTQVGVSEVTDELVFPEGDEQPAKQKRPRRTPPRKRP